MADAEESRSLNNKRVAFVGRLGGMSRREAAETVRRFGAKVSRKLDSNLNYIVLGDDISALLESENWLTPDMADAVSRGALQIISETELWQRLDELQNESQAPTETGVGVQGDLSNNSPESDLTPPASPTPYTRLFTPSMLASMFDLPVSVIRQWNRMGLIHPVRQVKKLPYYDLREVAGARSLAQALEKGVSPALLTEKLEQLGKYLPNVSRSINQLSILVSGKQVLFRKDGDLVDSCGQFRFDFNTSEVEFRARNAESAISPADTNSPIGFPWELVEPQARNETEPEERWDFNAVFNLALMDDSQELPVSEGELREDISALQQAGRLEEALAASRLLMLVYSRRGSDSPAAPEQLSEDNTVMADILSQLNQLDAARERLFVALELDSENLEARLTLGSILQRQGALDSAAAAFQGCLELYPDFPDAHYHLALLLDEQDKSDEALAHWKRFWDLAPTGPWKAFAADRLGLEPEVEQDFIYEDFPG